MYCIISGNDSFLQISNLTEPQISSSMTLFHIIQPHFFPKLFEFFTLTLRGRTNQHRRTSSSSRKRTRSLASSTTTNHSTEKERYNRTSSRDDTDAEALFGEDDNSEAFYAVSFPCETTHMNPNGRILSPTGIATKTTNSSSNSNMTDALVITVRFVLSFNVVFLQSLSVLCSTYTISLSFVSNIVVFV
jgi:hypothetical protein